MRLNNFYYLYLLLIISTSFLLPIIFISLYINYTILFTVYLSYLLWVFSQSVGLFIFSYLFIHYFLRPFPKYIHPIILSKSSTSDFSTQPWLFINFRLKPVFYKSKQQNVSLWFIKGYLANWWIIIWRAKLSL